MFKVGSLMIRVNATGCSLLDNLYGQVSFASNEYKGYLSQKFGDGGLTTGGLVFAEDFAAYAGESYEVALAALTAGKGPDSSNIGGPGIVPIIHCQQVNDRSDIAYRFAGVVGGRDENGRRFCRLMQKAGFPMQDYSISSLPTPCTDVLSDPAFNGGRGERTFINSIGAAATYGQKALPADFFEAEFLLFGGTGLVPPLQDDLNDLCRHGRDSGAFVLVNTVFDFRNEARMQGQPWPLVQDYHNIDLLILDKEESLKISGATLPVDAREWFLAKGCGAVIITQGVEEVLLGVGNSSLFAPLSRQAMPTCRYADAVLKELTSPRDTTGCGDNFVGGVTDSLARQMADSALDSRRACQLQLEEAVLAGVVAGSVTLTCLGGVYYEREPGQKRRAMQPYIAAYRQELSL